MKMPKKGLTMYYNIVSNDDNTEEIYIYGDITSWPWMESDVSSYRLANRIAQIPADKHINIHVNSYGGEVAEGLAIYNVLKGRDVSTFCDGFAASAASIVFCAGKNRIMNRSSLLFIHNAIGYYRGNSDDLEKGAEDLKKMNEVIRAAYIESGVNLTEEELEEMMKREEWILPEDAVKYNFATEIDTTDDEDTDDTIQNVLTSIQNKLVPVNKNKSSITVDYKVLTNEEIENLIKTTVDAVLNSTKQKSDSNEQNFTTNEGKSKNNSDHDISKKGFLGFGR
jgi:ATP-dependent Clp protease protease subunit